MKTRIIIILTFTALNIGLISANSSWDKTLDSPATVNPNFSIESLAPVTPAEATFEETEDAVTSFPGFISMAPVTPADATFDENIPDEDTIMYIAAPRPPKEASFED
jgi:hypothetical protein